MRRYFLSTAVIIICILSAWIYGKDGIGTTTGNHNPDSALSENSDMQIFYIAEQDTPYFCNDSNYKLEGMEQDSSLIALVSVTDSREMSLRSTKTMVTIEKIFKDNSESISVGDDIYIIEPVSYIRGEEFYTYGWQYMKTGDTYLVFLKNLECVEGYRYTKEEEISFMPVSEIFSKKNISHNELVRTFDVNEDRYINVTSLAFFTLDEAIVDNYAKIWQDIEDSGRYQIK